MVLECLPHLGALLTSFVKVLNVHLNRENVRKFITIEQSFRTIACYKVMTTRVMLQFKKLFDSITKEWQQLKLSQDLYILEEVTIRGSKMAKLYRSKLSCLKFSIGVLLVHAKMVSYYLIFHT